MQGFDGIGGDQMVFYSAKTFFTCAVLKAPRRYYYIRKNRYIRWCMGFDIETTKKDRHAFMWCWQMSCGEDVMIGRTWEEYHKLFDMMNTWLYAQHVRVLIWVANLGHEHSFIGRRHEWAEIFAIDAHEPLIARCGSIEYREALTISGPGGLKELAKNYTKRRKRVGDLDYTIQRNSLTPIDPDGSGTELGYITEDVLILAEWAEYIYSTYADQGKRIPLTATGIPREYLKAMAAGTGKLSEIYAAIKAVYPKREIYNFIMRYLFRGGYTHANIYNVEIRLDRMIGVDYDSSYPNVMEHEYYPVTPFVTVELRTDGRQIQDTKIDQLCCWMIVEFYNIQATSMHAIESEHKILKYSSARFDNGRLTRAKFIQVALTERDYQVYCMFYKWQKIKIIKAWSAKRGPLPQYVLKTLEHFYELKYNLKKAGRSKEPVYQYAKAGVNSNYGLMVQRLNMTEYHYDSDNGKWSSVPSGKTYRQMISRQLLSPFWGIWITAHARYNILHLIHTLDPDHEHNNVVYSDTDSAYFIDTPRNRKIIEEYNRQQREKNKKLPLYMHKLGCLDWIDEHKDGSPVHYRFKTLGAKRYIKCYCKDGEQHMECTIAGLPKNSLPRMLCSVFDPGDGIPWQDPVDPQKRGYVSESELFEKFNFYMLLSMAESDKRTCIYDPDDYEDTITDSFGNSEVMQEHGGACIIDIPFNLKSDKHNEFISLIYNYLCSRRRMIHD